MGRINRNGLDSTYSSISLVLWFRFNYLRIEYSVRVSACNGFFYSFFTFDGKKMLVDAVDFSTVRNIIEFFLLIFSTWNPMDRPKHKSSTVHAPFAVSPSVAVTLEVSILPFFSDRFHYTGTSVLIRPRRLKNSSLRLSVPVLDSGEFRGHFYVWWQKSSTTGHGV